MIIVSDSSPLIAFSLIGRLELIKELYETIIIPEAVHREITEIDEQRTGVQEIIAAEWLVVERITNERFVNHPRLKHLGFLSASQTAAPTLWG